MNPSGQACYCNMLTEAPRRWHMVLTSFDSSLQMMLSSQSVQDRHFFFIICQDEDTIWHAVNYNSNDHHQLLVTHIKHGRIFLTFIAYIQTYLSLFMLTTCPSFLFFLISRILLRNSGSDHCSRWSNQFHFL